MKYLIPIFILLITSCKQEEEKKDSFQDFFNRLSPMEQDNLIFGDAFDHFADSLTIPTDIDIEYPMDLDFDKNRPDSMLNLKPVENNFVLYNSFQPGLFEFDLWYAPKTTGTVYLKAYEITQNTRLSVDRLKNQSSIQVFPGDTLQLIKTEHHFTIYEGDWGKPYAARFEVWFEDIEGNNFKITEKNYIIEGWMR